jgi:hypothetical protein
VSQYEDAVVFIDGKKTIITRLKWVCCLYLDKIMKQVLHIVHTC